MFHRRHVRKSQSSETEQQIDGEYDQQIPPIPMPPPYPHR
jgi:hypothetical protein